MRDCQISVNVSKFLFICFLVLVLLRGNLLLLLLLGFRKQAVRLFCSAPIVKRYDFSTMETADGICVVIRGLINKPRTQENGFTSMVL